MPFIVGCPACRRNFLQLWCVTTCSPDQASFANVTAVQVRGQLSRCGTAGSLGLQGHERP